MKIVVPGLKMDLIDLSTNRAQTGCDAEIAEPRICIGSHGDAACRGLGLYICGED